MKIIFLTFYYFRSLLIKNYFEYISPIKHKNYKKALNDLKNLVHIKNPKKYSMIYLNLNDLLFKLIALSLPYVILFSILNLFSIDNIYKP